MSGVIDSFVLLHLQHAWRATHIGDFRYLVAHLNHQLRGDDADGDEAFCRRLAETLEFPFVAKREDAARYAEKHGLGVEAAGRRLRYRFFREAAGPDMLALTGHHADDQAETVLMHIRRGAHRRGMGGMKEFSLVPVPPDLDVPVGRPLLEIGRENIAAYARAHGLEWREDYTNQDPAFARNRIRHRIIPMLESVLPGFRRRLLDKAKLMTKEEETLTLRAAMWADQWSRREHGGRFLRLDRRITDEPEQFNYLLRHIVEEELGERLPYGAVLARLAELAGGGSLGEAVSLPGRLTVRRESDGLFFFFPRDTEALPTAEIILPDPPFSITEHGMHVSAEWLRTDGLPPENDRTNPEVEWFNPEALRWPLRLRPPFPGERFRPIGAPGSRKIQDILVDLKSPRRKRGLARVLADHAGAIWLWPYRLANRVRLLGKPGKALRVHMREER